VQHHLERLRMESQIGATLHQIDLRSGDPAIGKRLKDLGLPADCVIVSIHRGDRLVVPRGDSRLLPGDRLTVLAQEATLDRLNKILRREDDRSRQAPR